MYDLPNPKLWKFKLHSSNVNALNWWGGHAWTNTNKNLNFIHLIFILFFDVQLPISLFFFFPQVSLMEIFYKWTSNHNCFILFHFILLKVESFLCFNPMIKGYPRGVMVEAKDCGIVVSEIEFQSRFWERYKPPYPPSYGLNSTTTVLLEEWY